MSNDAAVTAVEEGKADVALEGVPPHRLQEVQTQYASQVDVQPVSFVRYVFLNTRLPPFNDIRVRRAFNYAVDRGTTAKLAGGPTRAQPTCQILPPNFPGHRRYCPYTLNPSRRGFGAPPTSRRPGD